MPIEHMPGEDTGIYREDRVRVTGPADMFAYLKDRLKDNWPMVDSLLADLERDARGVLAEHGFADWPIRRTQTVKGHKLPSIGTREADPPIVHDADQLLSCIQAARWAKANGDIESWGRELLAIGAYREKLAVRPFEEPAKLGRESLKFWRGAWVPVTPCERDILTIVSERSEVPLSELLAGAWNDSVPRRNRNGRLPTGRVRTAPMGTPRSAINGRSLGSVGRGRWTTRVRREALTPRVRGFGGWGENVVK